MTLTQDEINSLLSLLDLKTLQGKRDYLILSMLCRGIYKPQIARLRAYDFSVEGNCLAFDNKKHKIMLSPEVKEVWDAYIRSLIKRQGVEFVKTKPVLISFSTNKLKSGDPNFGITPEAIQQIIEKYFRKAGIEKKPYAGLFKQAKPKVEKQSTLENKLSKKFIPKRGVEGLCPFKHKKRNKRYRNKKRFPYYKFRLVESKFCLDANFLTRKGFFKGGIGGHSWIYTCSNKKDGYIAQAKIELIGSRYPDELAIRIEPSPILVANPSSISAIDTDCIFGGQRWWFYCPQCERKVFTLYYHFAQDSWIQMILACRRCHGLVYLSQMRGRQRIGKKEYRKRKEQFSVHKELELLRSGS